MLGPDASSAPTPWPAPPPRPEGGETEPITSAAGSEVLRWHGAVGGEIRLGIATWFSDVLVRFGYDLFEHEHHWDGEWIDDAFEAAALRMRATATKLVRVLDGLTPATVDAEITPFRIDLALAYLRLLVDDVAIVVPCCFGTQGRSLEPHRHDLAALAAAVAVLDAELARALELPPGLDLRPPTHSPELFAVLDGPGRATLPGATARMTDASRVITVASLLALDNALAELCPWFERVLAAVQRVVSERADDGDELLERWHHSDWSVVAADRPGAAIHLPPIEAPIGAPTAAPTAAPARATTEPSETT